MLYQSGQTPFACLLGKSSPCSVVTGPSTELRNYYIAFLAISVHGPLLHQGGWEIISNHRAPSNPGLQHRWSSPQRHPKSPSSEDVESAHLCRRSTLRSQSCSGHHCIAGVLKFFPPTKFGWIEGTWQDMHCRKTNHSYKTAKQQTAEKKSW